MPTPTAPTTTSNKGEIVLQPNYFTSSLYVNPLVEDIDALITTFKEEYDATHPSNAFDTFKTIWSSLGWPWLHFKIFDDRSRDTFLRVTIRLFLEKAMNTSEAPFSRVTALFGLYTFFYSQPSSVAPALLRVQHIPISKDHYNALFSFADISTDPQLTPLVAHMVSTMVNEGVFHILPDSCLRPYTPSTLPREIVRSASTADGGNVEKRKSGRPSKKDLAKRAKTALNILDNWSLGVPLPVKLDLNEDPATAASDSFRRNAAEEHYQVCKGALDPFLASSDGEAALKEATSQVLARLQREGDPDDEERKMVINRVERAAQQPRGMLRLTEGAGISPPVVDMSTVEY